MPSDTPILSRKRGRSDFSSDISEPPSQRGYITGTELIPYSGDREPYASQGYRRRSYYPRKIPYPIKQSVPFGRPSARGNAVINQKGLSELKYVNTDYGHIPISFGNTTPGGYTSFTGPQTDYFSAWDGTLYSAFIVVLNTPTPGADSNQRIGRKINLKSVLVKANWRIQNILGDDPINPVQIRTMLIWDKCPNGSYPAISDILQPLNVIGITDPNNPNNPLVAPCPASPNNLDNRDRFRTLWDANDTLSPGGESIRQYDKYLKLSGETIFSGDQNNLTSIKTGAIYLLLLSDAYDVKTLGEDDPLIVNRPICKVNCRVRFTDS